MTVPTQSRRPTGLVPRRRGRNGSQADLTAGEVVAGLLILVAFSSLLRIVLVGGVRAPTVFSDELGYTRLAESIGLGGHLGLFDRRGLSYSPLYPLLVSPVYALELSAPAAYAAIKVVNAILISLALVPVYLVARFVLPARRALLAAAISGVAPLMFYSSYTMSESLAYPACLACIWWTLVAIRTPRPRNDLVLLATLLIATAARVQLLVLAPAALTAMPLTALLERPRGGRVRAALARDLVRHRVAYGATAVALLVAALSGLAGEGVFSIFGRYAVVGRHGLPNAGHFLSVLAQHVAGLDLAVGFVPFAGTLVAAASLSRRGFPRRAVAFACVALSVSVWMLLEVAFDAAIFDVGADLPRIHERFLIYLVPLFVIALLSAVPGDRSAGSVRLYAGAGLVTALLPLAIPFQTVVNGTITADTFGLQPFARARAGGFTPVPHPAVVAVAAAAVLALLYTGARRSVRGVTAIALLPLVAISVLVFGRISSNSLHGRSFLPARADWVDAAKPRGSVVLLAGATGRAAARETSYFNLSIGRLYYLCLATAGPDFGERQVTIDRAGHVGDEAGPVRAAYAVAPDGLGVVGQVVARNRPGRQVLVRLRGGRLDVRPRRGAAALGCES